jgi:capsular polysaccharide transport system permease protein
MKSHATTALLKQYQKQILFLIVPFIVFLVYVGIFAIEKYRSESIYVIRDLSTRETMGVDLGIFGAGASSKKLDGDIVLQFLRSMDMFNRIDARFGLKERYRSEQTDILERLIWNPAAEDFLERYRKDLKIVPDELSGITTISFEGTDPDLAQSVLQYLLEAGEAFLNELNRNTVQKKIAFLAEQLAENRTKWDLAVQTLESFQNTHRLVDPAASLAAYHGIIAQIETDIVKKTSEYKQLLRYMSAGTIEAVKLKNEIEEQKASLDNMKSRLSGSDKQPLNELLFEHQRLKSDLDFAGEVYKSTLVQYELNKMEALRESKVFEVVARPTLPEGHVYPRRIRMTLTAVILILVGFKILMLMWAVIKDHKD